MKSLLSLILILIYSTLCGQNLDDINQSLNLPDSLTNIKEIRIYKGFGTTNYTGVFRLYQDNSNIWQAEYFDHFAKVPKKAELKMKKHELKPNKDLESIWWELLKTNIQDLPDMSEFEWKLKKNPQIVEDRGQKVLSWQKTDIIDGKGYVVCFRWGEKLNQITYWNPEGYLRIYEDVDELIYFEKLLNLVRNEFDLWKNN